jgi:LuxR family quorum sensing-dependent transcriptional regulator
MAGKYHEALDFIDRVKQIDAVSALIAEFQQLIERYGFNAYCVGNATAPKLPVEDRVWCATWPHGWASVWEEKNFAAVDPVVYQLLATRIPFRWRDVRRIAPAKGAEVMDVAGEFRLRDGLGIALFARDGHTIGVTIAGEQFALDDRERSCLHLAAIYFQARLEQLRAKEPRPKRTEYGLTTRELDCLSWMMLGKTDWEIGEILCISEETVHRHVKSVLKKLRAMNRAQAVAIGIVNRLIHP